jgi:hypothetical protein
MYILETPSQCRKNNLRATCVRHPHITELKKQKFIFKFIKMKIILYSVYIIIYK